MQQLPLRVRLGEAARFDGFIAGTNAEVVNLLTGPLPPRVLWLWGRAGTGKTHLLQAACAAASASGGAATYLDLEAGGAPALLDGCESLDVVCLDALDRVSDDADWNAAIFRLYTLMQDTPGRLYVGSTAPPASLRFRLPDLRSRLLAAPVYQLHELDEEGQVAALELRASRRGLELSREAAIVDDLDCLGMACASSANLIVGRILLFAPDVPGDDLDDAVELLERGFHAPEASSGEGGLPISGLCKSPRLHGQKKR